MIKSDEIYLSFGVAKNVHHSAPKKNIAQLPGTFRSSIRASSAAVCEGQAASRGLKVWPSTCSRLKPLKPKKPTVKNGD